NAKPLCMRGYLMVFCLICCTADGQIVYSIAEETERGASVGNIAKDLGIDASTLSARKFRMITGSSKQYFNINASTGALSVNEPIDREQLCELKSVCLLNYELVLENPLELYRMEFKVLDINDNSPSFPLSEYHINMPEFLSPGARFTLPSAQDLDEGANSVQNYTLSPDEHFYLEMQIRGDGSKYPELVLKKALDREQQATHRLVLTSAVPGARFHIESAQDPDVGTNSVQNYLLSPSRHFALDLKGFQSGSKLLELVLQQPLDREQSALQQLVLTAVDGGDPPKSGTAQISVRVVDTNDNPPAFDRSTYTVSLLENSLPGTLVVKLNASDPDEGSNGDVIYSFGSYTPQKVRQLFSVDPHSGEVRVNGTLDYEEASSYEIYVQATDQGPVSMAGHCKVLVNIVDANDNAPEVELTSLYSPVPEDARSGTVVALMSVTDQDSGRNKQVSLRIPPGLPFTLNSFKNSYTLVTQGKLDHEKAAAYNITVTATDSGTPPLSSQKVIHVEISDINDNPPRFEEPVYSVYIPENNPLGAFLCTIKATDPDVAKNAYVSYSLLDGEIEGLPVASYVSIKSDSGNMYAVRSFDYETLREFQVIVQAQDAGIPPLSSTVTVYIYVVDENDHAPQILYPTSTNTSAALEMIPRSAYAGYLVTKIIAIDGDSGQNAWLFFYLVQTSDPGLFRIELHTGEIRTTRKLGEDSTPTFNLTVEVRDNGEPSMSSSVAITIAVVDRVSKIIPDRRRHFKSPSNYSEVTLYLIIALSAISFVFLFTIIGLSIIKCYRYSLYGSSCCLKVQPHFIEVRGNGSLTKTYCYKACLTAGSGSDTFMFYNTSCSWCVVCVIRVVSFLHMLGLNSEALTGETNSGAQKENIAITVYCFCPVNCGRCKISLCINMCHKEYTILVYSCHRNRAHLFIYFYFFTYEDISIFSNCFFFSKDAHVLRASKSSIKMLLRE
uniref:Protocadherin gamma-C3 n=1 Tax=Cyanoderma ruficeps TaxID=181631 RepID=A0A8C3XEA5_9PASS